MKTIVGLVIIASLFLISGVILLVYYLQDVSIATSIKETISSGEIVAETSFGGNKWNGTGYSDSKEYISQVRVNIGKVTLENNGIFPYNFILPEFILCVDDSNSNNLPIKTSFYRVTDSGNEIIKSEYSYLSGEMTSIEVSPGMKEEYFIGAYYYPSLGVGLTSKSQLVGRTIKVYQLPVEEDNPLDESLLFDYSYHSCETVQEKDFVKTITIV